MYTTNLFKNFLVRVKKNQSKKKNQDWARVEEPDTIIKPMMYLLVAIVIAGFSMLAAFQLMTKSPIEMIAYFLVSLHSDLPFEQLYAAFGSALIAMIDLTVMSLFLFLPSLENDDVIEMISDLDANIQERIVEFESSINERLDAITRNE